MYWALVKILVKTILIGYIPVNLMGYGPFLL